MLKKDCGCYNHLANFSQPFLCFQLLVYTSLFQWLQRIFKQRQKCHYQRSHWDPNSLLMATYAWCLLAALNLNCIVAGIFHIRVFPNPISKKHSLDYKWPVWWILSQYLHKLIFNYLCFSTEPFDYSWLALETCRSTHAIGLNRKATGSVHCFVQKLAGSRRNCFMLDRFCLYPLTEIVSGNDKIAISLKLWWIEKLNPHFIRFESTVFFLKSPFSWYFSVASL